MDHYLEALAFSSEMVQYAAAEDLKIEGSILPGKAVETATRRFTPVIGEGVLDIMNVSYGVAHAIYYDIKDEGQHGMFGKLAIQAAVRYFPKGYTHQDFLVYSAMVTHVAVLLYRQRVLKDVVFETAAGVIATVFSGLMIGGGFDCSPTAWKDLGLMAQRISAAARNIVQCDEDYLQEILKGEWVEPPKF